jgi:hypothetical protein
MKSTKEYVEVLWLGSFNGKLDVLFLLHRME